MIQEFKRKYNKSKAEMQKDLGSNESVKLGFKQFEEVNDGVSSHLKLQRQISRQTSKIK